MSFNSTTKLLVLLFLPLNVLLASSFNVQEVNKYIYKIEVLSTNDINSTGSAVALSSDGKLITAYHGVDSIKSIRAIDYKGNTYNVTLGKVSVVNDLAYIHINAKDIEYAPIAKNSIEWAEDVYVLNSEKLLLKGIVSKIEEHGIIINTEISVGTSGGGVFNENNELIAIALRKDLLDKTSYAVNTKMFEYITDEYKQKKELLSLESNNYDYSYCNDKEDLRIWKKHSKSSDLRVQEFHAIFLGLCAKVKNKDLTTERAQFIFKETNIRLFENK